MKIRVGDVFIFRSSTKEHPWNGIPHTVVTVSNDNRGYLLLPSSTPTGEPPEPEWYSIDELTGPYWFRKPPRFLSVEHARHWLKEGAS